MSDSNDKGNSLTPFPHQQHQQQQQPMFLELPSFRNSFSFFSSPKTQTSLISYQEEVLQKNEGGDKVDESHNSLNEEHEKEEKERFHEITITRTLATNNSDTESDNEQNDGNEHHHQEHEHDDGDDGDGQLVDMFRNKAPLGRAFRQKEYDYVADVLKIKEKFPCTFWDTVDITEVARRRQDFFEMTREQRDFFMFGMLCVMDGGEISYSKRFKKAKRKNVRTFYCFNHQSYISRDLFLAIYGISKKYLDNLQKQKRDVGVKIREHGNKKRKIA